MFHKYGSAQDVPPASQVIELCSLTWGTVLFKALMKYLLEGLGPPLGTVINRQNADVVLLDAVRDNEWRTRKN